MPKGKQGAPPPQCAGAPGPVTRTLAAELLLVARAYGEATGYSPSTVGRYAVGRTSFFDELEQNPNVLRTEMFDRAMGFFSDRWERDVRRAWPRRSANRPPPRRIMAAPKKPAQQRGGASAA